MKSPIFSGLYKYAKMQRIPFNAPGHKGRVSMRAKSLSMLDLYGSSKDGDALNLRELTAKSEDEITKKYEVIDFQVNSISVDEILAKLYTELEL